MAIDEKEQNLMQQLNYYYRPTYLITTGIVFLIIASLTLISILVGFISNQLIILFLFIIIEVPIIIFSFINIYGGGTVRYLLKIDGNTFEAQKNLKVIVRVLITEIERIKIIDGDITSIYGGFKYIKLFIKLKNKKDYYLFIRRKKWMNIFLNLEEDLRKFCEEKGILYKMSKKSY